MFLNLDRYNLSKEDLVKPLAPSADDVRESFFYQIGPLPERCVSLQSGFTYL